MIRCYVLFVIKSQGFTQQTNASSENEACSKLQADLG